MTANTLERLVETLRQGILSIVAAPRGTDVPVHDVVVHDPLDRFEMAEGDLVLGVGLGRGPETLKLISDLARDRVAGIVLKNPIANDAQIVEAAEDAGVALLSVPSGASWSQITRLIGLVLSYGPTVTEDVHGFFGADLFALADAIAELVDAPVTIEDRLSRVLAYSGRQDEADAGRAETIIGRRVPERYVRKFEEEGVFERLHRERRCIYIDEIGEGLLPRLVVGVHAGDETLGSIWAAIPSRPSPEVERAFADTAKVAALHLLRHRAGAEVERNLQADLVANILQGTAGATEAAVRLGLAGASFRVLGAWISSPDEAEESRSRIQLRDLLALHMSTFRVRGAAALLGGIVYGVIATEGDPGRSESLAVKIAEDLTARPTHLGVPVIGIGGPAARLEDVPHSKREAEEALRVLRAGDAGPVATIEQVRLPALLARFSEIAATDKEIYEEKLAPLIESDRARRTAYIDALTAYFDEFGDYTAAAARLQIHPNTLRYRLRKAQELSGVRLDNADERLALMLLLRIAGDG